jgi:hypothetical protein
LVIKNIFLLKQTLGAYGTWMTERCGDPSNLPYHLYPISTEVPVAMSTQDIIAPFRPNIAVMTSVVTSSTRITTLQTSVSLPIISTTTWKTLIFSTTQTTVQPTSVISSTTAATLAPTPPPTLSRVMSSLITVTSQTSTTTLTTTLQPIEITEQSTEKSTITSTSAQTELLTGYIETENITMITVLEHANNISILPESLTTGYYDNSNFTTIDFNTSIPEGSAKITPEPEIENVENVNAKIGWFQLIISTGLLAVVIFAALVTVFKMQAHRGIAVLHQPREYFMEGEAHEMEEFNRYQHDPEFYVAVNPFNNDGSVQLSSFVNEHHQLQPVRPVPPLPLP